MIRAYSILLKHAVWLLKCFIYKQIFYKPDLIKYIYIIYGP